MSEEKLSMRQQMKALQRTTKSKRNLYSLLLIPIFIMILFLTTYFNFSSGFAFNPDGTTLGSRFYLSGPDPYLNMRAVEQTMQTGSYPFIQPHGGDADPLLNYPVGERGARPPLFNLFAVASASILQNFMPQMDAIGWSMLFLPCIYGALMVLPLYGIAKEVFNRKVALISAMLLPLIPIFIGGGHGAGFSLFDHDSFVQLLFITVFFFIIKMLKSPDIKHSLIYSSFAGLFVGAVYLTWTASQMIYLVLVVSLLAILIFSLLKPKNEKNVFIGFIAMSIVAFLVGLPWAIIFNDIFGFPLMMIGITAFTFCLYFIVKRLNVPWIVSIPTLAIAGFGSLLMLFFVNIGWLNLGGRINQLSIFFFGEGIYGSKISLTIAEAHTFSLSGTVMSVGPAIYWLGLVGLALFFVVSYRQKFRFENIFLITITLSMLWFVTTAGRFLNDLVPYLVIFAGFTTFVIIDKLKYQEVKKSIQAIGFFRGLKRGMSPIRIGGILFIVFLIMIPNGFLALDAAVPQVAKEDVFGKGFQGYFGQSLGQSYYWSDACYWLSQQDTNIQEDAKKPAVISWWDYGFYLASQSRHPTVADNYQDGIFPASNFHTASSEQEAVSVLIIRCIEGYTFKNQYKLPPEIKSVLMKYLPDYKEQKNISGNLTDIYFHPYSDFVSYFEDPSSAPSYNILIKPEYGNRQLYVKPDNARYHDCIKLLSNLTDEQVTQMYMDIKQVTGFDIRYYAVEQYDTQIFNVFSFLADKSTFGFVTNEDDYMTTYYEDPQTQQVYFYDQLGNLSEELLSRLTPQTNYKQAYFETMFYRTYYGTNSTRVPTYMLRHFSLVYASPYVVIAKYNEGARINGTVKCGNKSYYNSVVYAFDSFQVPHDYSVVQPDGSYSLIAPEGNVTLMLFIGQDNLNVSKGMVITEPQARRKEPFVFPINFTVETANLNITFNTNKTELNFALYGTNTGSYTSNAVNDSYVQTDLLPDSYQITVTNSTGSSLYDQTKFLSPGNNNITIDL